MKKWLCLLAALALMLALYGTGLAEGGIVSPISDGPEIADISIDAINTVAGQELTLRVTGDLNSKYVFCRLYRIQDGEDQLAYEVYSYCSDGDTEIQFPLEPQEVAAGSYRAEAMTGSMDQTPDPWAPDAQTAFDVEESDRPAPPSTTVTPDSCQMNDDFMISSYADPDVDLIEIQERVNGGDWDSFIGSYPESSLVTSTNFNWRSETWPDVRTYEFRAAACRNGLWSAWGEPAAVVVTGLGVCPMPQISAPDTIEMGQDLFLTLQENPYDFYNLNAYRVLGEGEDEELDFVRATYYSTEDGLAVSLEDVNPGDVVEFHLYVRMSGYQPVTATFRATVVEAGELEPGPAIVPRSDTWIVNRPTTVELQADHWDRAQIKLYTDEGRSLVYDQTYDVYQENFDIYPTIDEESILMARTQTNGRWTAWSSLTFTAQTAIKLPAPEVSLSAETLLPGEDLTVTMAAQENVRYYRIMIKRLDTASGNYTHVIDTLTDDSNLAATFDGYYLMTPGQYCVEASVEPMDTSLYAESDSALFDFEVVDAPLADAPVITFESTRAPIGQSLPFTSPAYERLCYTLTRDNTIYNRYVIYADQQDLYVYTWDSGDFDVSFSAWVDGRWSAWTEPVTLTFYELPRLPAPQFTLSGTELLKGENLVVTFEPQENVGSFQVEYGLIDEYEMMPHAVVNSISPQEGNALTIQGIDLLEPGRYGMRIYAYPQDSAAYQPSESIWVTFEVQDAPMPEAPVITFESTEGPLGNSLWFTADRGEALYYILTDEADGTTWYRTIDSFSAGSQESVYQWEAGSYDIVFSALVDGRWSAWTEPVTLTFYELPRLPQPTFTLSDTELLPGEQLDFTVEPQDNVDYYDMYVYRMTGENGPEYIWNESFSADDPNMYVRGYKLMEPGEYEIEVMAIPSDSTAYNSSEWATTSFTIAEAPLPEAPTVTFEKTSAGTGRPFWFTVSEGDQVYYKVTRTIDGNTYEYTNGLSDTDTYGDGHIILSLWEADEFEFSLTARVNGRWTAWTQPVTLTIYELPKLDTPTISIPSTELLPGEDIVVTVEPVEGAEYYEYFVYRRIDEWNQENLYAVNSPLENGRHVIYVEDSDRWLAGEYELQVRALPNDADNWMSSEEAVISYTVLDEPWTTAPDLNFIRTTITYGEAFEVDTSDVEYDILDFELLDEYGDVDLRWNRVEIDGDTLAFQPDDIGEYPTRYRVHADSRWSEWRNGPTLIVEEPGQLAAPQVILPGDTLSAACDFRISVIPAESNPDESVYLEINRWIGDEWVKQAHWYMDVSYGSERNWTVEGYYISEPGEYRICAYTYLHNAQDYPGELTELDFTVEGEALAAPQLDLARDSAGIGAPFEFTIQPSNANRLECRIMNENGDIIQYNGYYSPGGSFSLDLDWAGDFTLIATYRRGSQWSAWSEPIALHVLDLPALSTPQLIITPEQPVLGDDIIVSCAQLPGAGKVWYQYWWDYDDGDFSSTWSSVIEPDGSGAFSWTISTLQIDEPAELIVVARYLPTADGGYSRSEWTPHITIRVEAGEPLAAPLVALESDEILAGKWLRFTAAADGLDQIYYQICDSEGNVTRSGYLDMPDADESFEAYLYSEEGSYTLRVRGHINGRWSDWSESIPFTVVPWPKIPEPTLSIPAVVVAGADLNDIILISDEASEYEIELLRYIEPEEEGEEGEWDYLENWWYSRYEDRDWDERQYVGSIPGYWLDAGTTYRIEAYAIPLDYEHFDSSETVVVEFTPVGETAAAPTLTVTDEKDSWMINEIAHFAVDTDYERVGLRLQYDDGDYTYTYFEEYAADEPFELLMENDGTWFISASVQNDGLWSQWSEPVTLTVDMTDWLEDPIVTHSPWLKGEDFVVTIVADEFAETYTVRLNRYDDYDSTVVYQQSGELVNHTATIRIDKSIMTEGEYELFINTLAIGYVHAYDWIDFRLGGRMDLPKALKVIGEEAFYGTDAQAIVIPSGCVSIGKGAFRGSNSLNTVIVPASVTDIDPDAFPETKYYDDDYYYNPITIVTPAGSTADRYARSRHMNVINR